MTLRFTTDSGAGGSFGSQTLFGDFGADGGGIFSGIGTRTNGGGTSASSTSAGATLLTGPAAPNNASYYGLNIPVSMGKRALTGVPIFAGPVRVDGSARFIDVAYAFGESGVPDDELLDTQLTRLWVNGELVEERNISTGWNSSGSLNYVIYPGYQDQFVDPRIEKWLGEGQAPAFRGLIYIMFYDFPLHQFSPDFSIPFVRAELVDIVQSVVQVSEFTLTAPGAGIVSNDVIIPNWDKQHVYLFETISTTEEYVTVVDLTSNQEISRNRILNADGTVPTSLQIASRVNGAAVLEPDTGFLFTQVGVNNHRPVITVDPNTGIILGEFGDDTTATRDNLTGAAAHKLRAPVSRGGAMTDRLICTATQVGDERIGFWRIAADGEPSLAYADTDDLLGTGSVEGDVQHIITGDQIRQGQKGFGTVFVGRETAVYRITIQEGSTGDGSVPDVPVDKTPLHLPTTTTPFGVPQSAAYVDIVETWDATNLAVAATEAALSTGQPTFGFDLSDAGDLSAAALDARVVAYIKYESIRTFRQFFINTLVLDGLHTGGVAEYDIVVSDNGTNWTLVSDSNVTNTEKGVFIGSNAPAIVLSSTQATLQMSGESYLNGFPFAPLPSGQYVGFALKQKNYTNGSVSGFTPWAGGQDGLVQDNDIIVFDDLLLPHMIKLWDVPTGHTVQMMFLEPKSEDIIVFFRNTATGNDWAVRLALEESIHGVPEPPEPLVSGGGVSVKWMEPLIRNVPVWANLEYSWNYSDLGSGILARADSTTNTITLMTISTGHQRELEFGPTWRTFGAASDDPESIDMQDRQVWNGSGTYLISQWNDAIPVVGFHMSKLTPFSTADSQYELAKLLRWMSLRVGYTAEDIDTSSVTDLVVGAILLERVSFRSLMGGNIGPAYDFEVFESEGKIKFVKAKKGAAFAAALIPLTTGDLAPIEGGDGLEAAGADAKAIRAPASDVPDSIEMKYLDFSNDYVVNSAYARRTKFPFNTTGNISTEPAVFSIPIVMGPPEAMLRATRLLYRGSSDSTTVEYRVPTSFLTLEPADVVSIPIDGVSYNVRNVETVINADHSVSVIGNSVSAEEVDVIETQDPIVVDDPVVNGSSSSNLFLLDIPALQSADVNAFEGLGLTMYTAVLSKGQGSWSHAHLFVGLGTGFFLGYTNGSVAQASGVAQTILPKGVELRSDHESTLRVQLSDNDGTLATITDQEILDGGNLCAYGRPGRWEIMQVQTVTLVSGNTYDLTDIIRGEYGTEAFSGAHLSNDQFVMLTNRPPVRADSYATYDELNNTIQLKAVGAKEDEPDITPETFRMSGAFERMLPPTNLKATLNVTDIDITWDRRTRLTNVWVDSLESVPLEDTADGFEVEILGSIHDTIPIRTFPAVGDPPLTDLTVKYLAADIATDFTNTPDTVYIRVYHLSTEVGRGLPEQKELDVL